MDDNIKNFIISSIKSAVINKDNATYYHILKSDEVNRYAVVIGWNYYCDRKDFAPPADFIYKIDGDVIQCLCIKYAYQPLNYGMRDYDIDWIMPYDNSTNEVSDNEMMLNYDEDIDKIYDYMMVEFNNHMKMM